jgi:hypothetical protein
MDRATFHVFFSHNSIDKPTVEELAFRLRKEGIHPWLDKWNLIPGVAWQPVIEEALDDCATCAVFVGPSGIGPWRSGAYGGTKQDVQIDQLMARSSTTASSEHSPKR